MFDLEALPCPERADAWEEAVSRTVLPVTCRFLDPQDHRGRLASMPLGCGELTEATYSAMTAGRCRRLIRRDDPEVYELVLVTHGGQGVEQHRRQALVRPGEMVLCDSSLPFTARTAVTSSLSGALVLRLPHQLVRLPQSRLTCWPCRCPWRPDWERSSRACSAGWWTSTPPCLPTT
ncbi:AraC-like ligand-binding domain-containing protein [Streptomyces sp. CO7]